MGCRLPKLRKAEERRSPGNIYSTLRRPQVETKVGVAYTYHFLDFLLGKEEVPVSSVLCLSSVRELPVQVRELYTQGFVLVAVHPFVHPCGPRHAHIQRQLHRAVLVRETPSSEKNQLRWSRSRLETDVCVAGHQAADPEVIQSYVKKIQDVAEQGVMFVGFLQQPGGGPCYLGHWDPEELSSLHSSPSPIHRHPLSANASPTEPGQNGLEPDRELDHSDVECSIRGASRPEEAERLNGYNPVEAEQVEETSNSPSRTELDAGKVDEPPEANGSTPANLTTLTSSAEKHFNRSGERERRVSGSDGWLSSPELGGNNRDRKKSDSDGKSSVTTHINNNHVRTKGSEKGAISPPPPPQARMQLFALYNHTEELNTSLRFYSLRVPLRVHEEAGLITELDANWLDHMTQHFTSGAQLIDGFFHLGDVNENGVSSVDSVFILRSSAEENANASYDAIVVEQWTVVDGVVVKADYVPLLQSLAPFGWRLMCVLPTPIVKTNGDGSLSTKQILFLQRPILQRKRKDFKMLNLRGRSKTKKNSAGETLEERENRSPLIETEMDRLRGDTTEEEEEETEGRRDRGRSSGASLRRSGGGGEREEDGQHQTGLLLPLENGDSVEDREEETDVDVIPLSKAEKSVRWTDFCRGDDDDDGGVKEEVRMEERIKRQLFSGVC